ncbi:MAG: ATP-binding protein [Pyrinomonadaceae bacterium]
MTTLSQQALVVLDALPEATVVAAVDGRIVGANSAFAQLTGHAAADLLTGRDIFDLIAPSDRAKFAAYLKRCARSRQMLFGAVDLDTSAAAPPVPLRCEGTLFDGPRPSDPGPSLVLLRFRPRESAAIKFNLLTSKIAELNKEIAERRKVEAERQMILEREQAARRDAEAANRAKDEFLAVLSHELRTPLHAIGGWLSLLRAGQLDRSDRDRAFATIERAVAAQNELVNDLLDISRIAAGKLELESAPVDLHSIVADAAQDLQPDAAAAGQRLVADIDETAGVIDGDASALRRVMTNLISNAIKFTPSGGTVSVSLRRQPGADGRSPEAVIEVADTGEGIAADFLPFIFDRFRQADSSSRRRHGGLGLGLAIARHLVEQHGGTIEAFSDGPGKGTTFTVRLPVASGHTAGDAKRGSTAEGRAASGRLSNARVLVVDDDRDALEMLSLVLASHGASVHCVDHAAAARSALASDRFDLLISDIGMPGSDGYDLIRAVREELRLKPQELPAIALSGYTSVEDRERAFAAGFQLHVSKPVELADFPAAVISLLGRR